MEQLRSFISKYKASLLLFFLALPVFLVLLFPLSDIGDLVSAKVAEFTDNKVFLQFDEMSITLLPRPGVAFENVQLYTPFVQGLKVDRLTAAPSLTGLLTFKPGISFYAQGVLGGEIGVSTRGGETTQQGTLRQKIDLNLNNVDLRAIVKAFDLSIPAVGSVSATVNLDVDPSFVEPPTGSAKITGSEITANAVQIPTQMGPISLPNLKVSSLEIQVDLKKGEAIAKTLRVGTPTDPLHVSADGKIEVRTSPGPGGQPNIELGGYDFSVRLDASKEFESQIGFLGFLDSYKAPTQPPGRSAYAVRISAPSIQSPARMNSL